MWVASGVTLSSIKRRPRLPKKTCFVQSASAKTTPLSGAYICKVNGEELSARGATGPLAYDGRIEKWTPRMNDITDAIHTYNVTRYPFVELFTNPDLVALLPSQWVYCVSEFQDEWTYLYVNGLDNAQNTTGTKNRLDILRRWFLYLLSNDRLLHSESFNSFSPWISRQSAFYPSRC